LVVCASRDVDSEGIAEFAGPLEAAWFASAR